MGAGTARSSVTSSINSKSNGACYNNSCQGCTLIKSEVQALEKEIKSMSEIINTLWDELKNNCAYGEDCKPSNMDVDKLKSSTFQCHNCAQLESNLQVVLKELSSVKLITEILSGECKFLKQTYYVDPNIDNLWYSVNPRNSSDPTATRPPVLKNSSPRTSKICKYTVPSSNRYAILTTMKSSNLRTHRSLPTLANH